MYRITSPMILMCLDILGTASEYHVITELQAVASWGNFNMFYTLLQELNMCTSKLVAKNFRNANIIRQNSTDLAQQQESWMHEAIRTKVQYLRQQMAGHPWRTMLTSGGCWAICCDLLMRSLLNTFISRWRCPERNGFRVNLIFVPNWAWSIICTIWTL